MGVGTVADLIAAIDAGIDMFDCVYPTRCGRNGRAITRRRAQYPQRGVRRTTSARSTSACGCAVCAQFTRAYVSHLFRSREMLGPQLLSYHNLAELLDLTAEARRAISAGRWDAFRHTVLAARAGREPAPVQSSSG
jgi:queuine tRNA-ribosyltransferase